MPETDLDVRRQIAGKALDRLGQYGLPLCIGGAAGYWAADLGLPWLPHMLEILSLLLMGSLALILIGYRLRRKHVRETESGAKARRRVVALLVLALLAASFHLVLYWARQTTPLTAMTPDEFQVVFARHATEVDELYRQMDRLLVRLEAHDFGSSEDPDRRPLTGDEEKLLREAWSASYHCAFALDQLRIFYEDWYRFDPSRASRGRLLRSYMLTFEAELSLFETSLRWVRLVDASEEVRRFLDAPHPEVGLGEHSFSVFRQELQGARDQARVVAGEAYMRWLESTLRPRGLEAPSSLADMAGRVETRLADIRRVAPLDRLTDTLKADTELLHRSVRRTWFPTQKSIANWMGTIKTKHRGPYLITPELAAAMDPHLEPGDVLLSRKNWHLTNVGLPGFWPHAILYLGDVDKLTAYFDTPEVRDWTRSQGADSLPELLQKRSPEAWGRYRDDRGHLGPDPHGEPLRLLEAVADGVVLTTFHQGFGDYLAALRPRLDKKAKAQALVEAFRHVGKPYDYDFDFATDHALVCTEVVWRSYRPGEGKDGLDLPVQEVAGRLTLPANEIARAVAEAHGTEATQLDWVYFIDTLEAEGRAFATKESDFLASHLRTKWDPLLD